MTAAATSVLAGAILLAAAPVRADGDVNADMNVDGDGAAPQVVVVDASPAPLPAPYDHLDLAADVGQTVTAAGCRVEATCRGGGCSALPARPGRQLFTVSVSYDPQAYSCAVLVEVRAGAGRPFVYSERALSPLCPAADALEQARSAARVACLELRKELAAQPPPKLAPAAARPPPAARSITTPTATSLPLPPPPLRPPPDRGDAAPPSRALPLVALGAGTAALLAGGVLLYLDGRPTACTTSATGQRTCGGLLDTTRVAIPLVLLGAGGVGWGAWRLGQSQPAPALIAVAGRGLVIAGRF
jgi:hypothetical protein